MIKKNKLIPPKKTFKRTDKRQSKVRLKPKKSSVLKSKKISKPLRPVSFASFKDQTKSFQNHNPLILEEFLFTEQNFYSADVLDQVIDQNSEVIENDSQTSSPDFYFEPRVEDLLAHNDYKLHLSEQGESKRLEKTYQQLNSAYLLDLKNKSNLRGETSKSKQPKNFIDQVYQQDFFVDQSGVAKKEKLIEKLDRLGETFYQKFSRLLTPSDKPLKVQSEFSRLSLNKTDRLLINLKFALNFALIALLMVLPIKGVLLYQNVEKTKGLVLGFSQTAWEDIKQGAVAASDSDWPEAISRFSLANDNISQALTVVDGYNQTLIKLLKVVPTTGSKLKSAENLLLAGKYLSFAAQNLAEVFYQSKSIANSDLTITDNLSFIKKALVIAKDDLAKAIDNLTAVDPQALPQDYTEVLSGLQQQLPQLKQNLQTSEELLDLSLAILGHEQSKRFLFMFQNTNELRPSGGFFGSFALVDIEKGKIAKMESPGGGPYDLKGYFTEKIISPAPLHLVGTAWEPWDANWWPDFETSAKKVAWFFEESEWPTVDGVIAINSSFLPELLKIVGEVELPEYDQVLTSENVVLALQHETLFEYDKAENKPKQVIADLMPVLVDRLLSINQEQTLPLLLTLDQAFQKKEIQFYFADQSLQSLARKFHLTGDVLKTNKDYLMVVDTNIAGGKTNGVISQQINHYAEVQADGSIIDNVSITRTHQGNPEDVFERVNNVSYLRIYVPQGSQLLEVSGHNPPSAELFKEVYPDYHQDDYLNQMQGQLTFDQPSGTTINQELGKTVFGNWIQVEPGQSATITFSYRLPFKLLQPVEGLTALYQKALNQLETENFYYSLLIQKQSGAANLQVKSFLKLPSDYKVNWKDSTNQSSLDWHDSDLTFATDLMTDQYYAVLLE